MNTTKTNQNIIGFYTNVEFTSTNVEKALGLSAVTTKSRLTIYGKTLFSKTVFYTSCNRDLTITHKNVYFNLRSFFCKRVARFIEDLHISDKTKVIHIIKKAIAKEIRKMGLKLI